MFDLADEVMSRQFLAACKMTGGTLVIGAVGAQDDDGNREAVSTLHCVTSEREFLTLCLAYYRANMGVEVSTEAIDELLSETRRKGK